MKKGYLLLPAVLRAAIKDSDVALEIPQEELSDLYRAARSHYVLPLVTEALWKTGAVEEVELKRFINGSKKAVVAQAQRTGSFLLLYLRLKEKGLSPVVLKGIVCRSLYPTPEQRLSVDEDFLIDPADFYAVEKALIECGMTPETIDEANGIPDERAYFSADKSLVIEVHTTPFSTENTAYSELNGLFSGVLDRTVELQIEGVSIRTLAPTDHLLYLICHAYKHFLHAGVGIRQVCDMCLMNERYGDEIDWEMLYEKCRSVRIHRFAAGLFRIGEKYLGFSVPELFSDIEENETNLLVDILTGGLYGVSDIDRAHSSNITIEAVASQRQGRRNKGVLSSLFPQRAYMEMKYGYVKDHPWLLPVAWGQRITGYLLNRKAGKKGNPGRSLKIGRERTDLLKEYGIID